MPEIATKPLQATFDVDEYEGEVVEGTGFEPGKSYTFTIEKDKQGKFMQYGANKGNLSNLYVLSKKTPKDLLDSYIRHPDQFEIFQSGEINGQQALIPGKDYDKFKPYLSKTISIAFVHTTDTGTKRLVFMQFNANDQQSVNPKHPEWESFAVLVSRKFGYIPPVPGSKEKFSFSWLHPGVTINAEVKMTKRKGSDRENPEIDWETIELLDSSGKIEPQTKITGTDLDPEIKAIVIDLAKGCTTVVEVIRKVKKHLKDENKGEVPAEDLRKYSEAITRLKDSKEILA